jgi:chromosome segregation ATPase
MEQIKQKMALLSQQLAETNKEFESKRDRSEKMSQSKCEVEDQAKTLFEKYRVMGDAVADKEKELLDVQSQIVEFERTMEESVRTTRSMTHRNLEDDKRAEALEKKLKVKEDYIKSVDESYDEARKRLIELEARLELAEEAAKQADVREKEMDRDLHESTGMCRSLKINGEKATKRETMQMERIRKLTVDLHATEERAEKAEQEIIAKARKLEELQAEIDTVKEDQQKVKEEMDAVLNDLQQL